MRTLGSLCIYSPITAVGGRFLKPTKICFPIPVVKLTFVAECDESEEKLNKMKKFREAKANSQYETLLNKERERIRHEINKEKGLGLLSKKEEFKEILARMEEEGVYEKVKIPSVDVPKLEDVVSKPKDGNQLILEDWDDRMEWIVEAAKLYHKRWDIDPEYMKSELSIMAGWVDTPDEYPDFFYGTDLY